MPTHELIVLGLVAIAAGAINGAVGSGSLITLPILLAFGLPPTTAVTTNTIAMVSSAFGGVLAYRRELAAESRKIRPLQIIAFCGALLGAVLLLLTPPGAIDVVVPALIVFALLLVLFQPRIAAWVRSRTGQGGLRHPYQRPGLRVLIGATTVYGGYFVAAQGVLMLGILGAYTGKPLGVVNGVKNLLSLTVNSTAALVYTVVYFMGQVDVRWVAVAVMAAGAWVGGFFGGRFAKRVPAGVLRAIIAVVALASLVKYVV